MSGTSSGAAPSFLARKGESKGQTERSAALIVQQKETHQFCGELFFFSLATNSWKNLCDRAPQGKTLGLLRRPPSLRGCGNSSCARERWTRTGHCRTAQLAQGRRCWGWGCSEGVPFWDEGRGWPDSPRTKGGEHRTGQSPRASVRSTLGERVCAGARKAGPRSLAWAG